MLDIATYRGDLEHKAITRLQEAARLSEFYYEKPILLAYSGGKDSEVCLELCKRAGVAFEVVHNLTTADAPETVYHVKKVFRRLELDGIHCEIAHPRYQGKPTSMWQLIVEQGIPPLMNMRYCCKFLKENTVGRRCVVLGIRAAESSNRRDAGAFESHAAKRKEKIVFDMDNEDGRIFAPCVAKARMKSHPIVDWSNSDVWGFLRDAKSEVNPIYSYEGFYRVGCVGCPMASKRRWRDFQKWPKYEAMYRSAFSRMLERREAKGLLTRWNTADEVFRWWMEDKNLDGQLDLFGGEVGADET